MVNGLLPQKHKSRKNNAFKKIQTALIDQKAEIEINLTKKTPSKTNKTTVAASSKINCAESQLAGMDQTIKILVCINEIEQRIYIN